MILMGRAVARAVLTAVFLAHAAGLAAAEGEARLKAEYGNLRKNPKPRPSQIPDGTNWWLYDVSLREETGRTGALLTGWRKCYGDPEFTVCDPLRRNIKELFGTDRVSPGGMIRLRQPAWVWAEHTGYLYTISVTYYGLDDKGNNVEASYSFKVKSD